MATEPFNNERRDFLEDLVYSGYEPFSTDGSAEGVQGSTPGPARRYTQDSPVMPDVWIEFGLYPRRRHDLLLTPSLDRSPGLLKVELKRRLEANKEEDYEIGFGERAKGVGLESGSQRLAFNQTTVAGELWFHELIRSALPLTAWWRYSLAHREDPEYHPVLMLRSGDREALEADLLDALTKPGYDSHRGMATRNLAWMARVVGTISLATDLRTEPEELTVDRLRERSRDAEALVSSLVELLSFVADSKESSIDSVFDSDEPGTNLHSINRNRESTTSIHRSVPTIKADAAQRLFDVKGRGITWAVLDSGIDATHWAFRKRDIRGVPSPDPFTPQETFSGPTWRNNTRIKATYDFTNVRDFLSDEPDQTGWNESMVAGWEEIQGALSEGRMIDWERVAPALRIDHDGEYRDHYIPANLHGTHVAGILGADWRGDDDEDDSLPFSLEQSGEPNNRTGVSPEITLYDLRVVGPDGTGSEFAAMAALQFVRSLNVRRDYVEIHGVNLSLSLQHQVSNYACGRTPICNESDRLVGAGTVVVAAAGNNGRIRFLTRQGDQEAYLSISITDPGNAESVITVGATHGLEPHNYGVSYFSSRGPTGDGRLKPDLVAPGEKISAPIPHNREETLDGTSMAAPHVSGAAALLMSRNIELVGQPLKIKRILCENATDLGREAYFQGAGLLDILRALQAV